MWLAPNRFAPKYATVEARRSAPRGGGRFKAQSGAFPNGLPSATSHTAVGCGLAPCQWTKCLWRARSPRGRSILRLLRAFMTLESFAQSVIEFVRAHEAWAAPVVFVLSFGESLAFVSLLLPATVILVGIGALIGASGIEFVPVWLAAAFGAALGDWLSYWFGHTFKTTVATMWPLSRSPQLLPRGEMFVKRWGVPGVFIGRFFGPARAAVPLVAGIFGMQYWPFQLANFSSAFIWAALVLAPGMLGVKLLV